MKKLFKWVFRLIIALVIMLALLVLFRDNIAKAVVARQVRNDTGMAVTIGRVRIGIRSPTVTIQDFILMNTADFGGSRFLDLPEVHVEYDRTGLFSGKVHLKLLRFNLGEIHVVQNKNGKTNLQALAERRKQRKPVDRSGEPPTEFQGIDTLVLSLGRFKFTSHKTPGADQEIWVGVKNETVKNVKSAKDLEPLFARIALERGARILTDTLYQQGAPLLDPQSESATREIQKKLDGLTEPLKKENN